MPFNKLKAFRFLDSIAKCEQSAVKLLIALLIG